MTKMLGRGYGFWGFCGRGCEFWGDYGLTVIPRPGRLNVKTPPQPPPRQDKLLSLLGRLISYLISRYLFIVKRNKYVLYRRIYYICVLIWRLRRLGRRKPTRPNSPETTIFYFLVAYFNLLTPAMVLSDRDQFLKNGRHLAGDATDGTADLSSVVMGRTNIVGVTESEIVGIRAIRIRGR